MTTEQTPDFLGDLESALAQLVNRCNNDDFLCTDDAVIHAEAVLEQLYKWRTAQMQKGDRA